MATQIRELIKQHIITLSNNPTIKIIQEHVDIYLVGGYIRSIMKGEKPNDIDLFTTCKPNGIAEKIKKSQKEIYVRTEFTTDYDGLALQSELHPELNLSMMAITIYHDNNKKEEGWTTESIDIVFGSAIDKHNTDFDINSMMVEIPKSSQSFEDKPIFILHHNKISIMNDEELVNMSNQINKGLMNISTNIQSLEQFSGTIRGAKLLLKRLGKRMYKSQWKLMPTKENINILLYIFNHTDAFRFRDAMGRHRCKYIIYQLILFILESGSPEQLEQLKTIINTEKIYFEGILKYNLRKANSMEIVESIKNLINVYSLNITKDWMIENKIIGETVESIKST